jgi:23S rRNA (adenine1618-N6)-methyltransferase
MMLIGKFSALILGPEQVVSTPYWVVHRGRNGNSQELVGQVLFSLESSPNSILDIDGKSLQFARQNVQANNLHERIKLLQTKPDGPLLPLDIMGFEQ